MHSPPHSSPVSPTVRASDAERESVIEELREHCAAGRLTADELSERIASVYAARTLAELHELTRDLPELEPTPRNVLAREVASELARGWRVEWQSERETVLVKGKRPNHVLHACVTILTGIWALVWLAVALDGRERRMLVGLNETGRVYRRFLR